MIKKTISTIFFVLSITISNAQQRTPYQKQVDQIMLSVIKSLKLNQVTINKYLPNKIEILYKSDAVQSRISSLNPAQKLHLQYQYSEKIRNARRYMNMTDFKRESHEKKVGQINYEKTMKLVYSDWSYAQSEALTKFSTWREKGEFEKSTDHKDRILKYSDSAYKRICYEIIITALARVNFEKIIGVYDTDNESYPISFWLKDYEIPESDPNRRQRESNEKYRNGFTVKLHVPISEAPSFKQNFDSFQVDVKPNDWNYYDDYIFPTKLLLIDQERNRSYKCEFPKGQQITQTLANYETGNYMVFDYSSAVNKVIQESTSINTIKGLAMLKNELGELKKIDGKYCSVSDLFNHPLLKKRLKEMLSSEYDLFMTEIDKVEGPIVIVDNVLFCTLTTQTPNKFLWAALMIPFDTNQIFVCIQKGDDYTYYTEVDENGQGFPVPDKLLKWAEKVKVNSRKL